VFVLPETTKRNPDLSARAKSALYYLASLCGAQNHCFPYVQTISEGMSTGIRTAQRAIAELLDKGLIKRKLRHHHMSAVYTLPCLERRGPTRAETRREAREKSRTYPTVINSPQHRGVNPDTPILEQTTQENNDHYSTEYVPRKVLRTNQQGYSQANNGYEALNPRKMHPAEAKLVAEDLAQVLGWKSFKWFLRLAWRVGEETLYECLSWVKQEMAEGKATNPGGLFTSRLRTFYNLRI
jgi:hypothetical protein